MLLKEWKSLFKNKIFLIVLIAITTIPTIYTTIFLGSMWDPYGEIDHLPVAVVNNDVAVEYNGKTMNVGEELVDNLSENNSLDFNFVDEETATAGLANGTYYMVVTIPEDFSANATTLMEETPKKMNLEYTTNPGTNYIASKMSESAVEKIRVSVAEKITKQYAETIFDQLSEIGEGFTDAAEGTAELDDGFDQLIDGNIQISENLSTLADSSLTFKEGSETLEVGIKTYTDGVSQVNEGAGQLEEGISTLADGAGTLTDGATQLNTGASSLEDGVTTYTDGVKQLYEGTQQLVANNAALNEGISTLGSGVTSLKSGSSSILAGLNTMSTTLKTSLSTENKQQLETLYSGITQVDQGLQQLDETLQSVDLTQVETLVSSVTGGLTSVGDSTKSAASHLAGVQSDLQTAVATIQSNEGFQSLSQTDQAAILQAIGAVGADGGNLKSVASDLATTGSTLESLNNGISGSNLSALENISTLKTSVSTLASKGSLVLNNCSSVIKTQQAGLTAIQDALDREGKSSDQMGLIQGMTALEAGITQIDTGVNNTSGLKASIATYTAAVSTVNEGLNKLDSNSQALTEGASQLADGLSQLAGKVPALTEGITQLQAGAVSLQSGTNQLVENNSTLLDGVSQLSEGAEKISDGSSKLADASITLGEGLSTAQDGVITLHDALSDAADEINSQETNDDTYDMLATPVESTGSEATSVDNNGNAMAAYMMGVGLWVACITLCMMYPLEKPAGEVKNAFSWWFSKATVVGTIAVVQGILMVYMLKWTVGFNPTYFGKTLLIAVLASLAFMSIMYFFNLLLGKVGSFLLLIFMMLQLGGSAGTYPIELSGSFYQAIHPFMPFTYSVNAFRSTIASGQSLTVPITVFVGIILFFTAASITVFYFKAKKIVLVEERIAE